MGRINVKGVVANLGMHLPDGGVEEGVSFYLLTQYCCKDNAADDRSGDANSYFFEVVASIVGIVVFENNRIGLSDD